MTSTQGRADGGTHLAYMPGVDGLRAIAVAAVVVFHLGAGWLPGGYLGVDVFLVISGYLITSLLVAEHTATGRIDLVRFWLRRARQLLPAVFLMMAVVIAVMLVLHHDEVARMRGAVAASVGYVTNWYFVVADVPYFERFGRPPVFLHLWSLAVEEQFYLVWPLVLAAGLVLLGRTRVWAIAGVGLAVSVALGWWWYDPFSDTDRLFYGTDTRAVGLLVGVLLALAMSRGRGRARSQTADAIGLLGAVAVAVAFVRLDSSHAFLYRGGLLFVAVGSAALIVAAARHDTLAGRLLGAGPFVWIGKRSYGIYLWHWPVIQLTRADADVPFDGPALVVIQLMTTVVAAAISYRFVEAPFRRHGVRGVARALASAASPWRLVVRRVVAAGGVVGLAAVVLGVVTAPSASAGIPVSGQAAVSARAATTNKVGPPILFVGDSVMLVAAPELRRTFGRRATVDAKVGRRFPEGTQIVLGRLRNMPADTAVVVHLGSNYYVRPEQVDALVARVPAAHPLHLITVRVDLAWQDSVNTILRDAAARHPRVRLIDWYAASDDPGLFVDGAHTNPRGSRLYARTVGDALRDTP